MPSIFHYSLLRPTAAQTYSSLSCVITTAQMFLQNPLSLHCFRWFRRKCKTSGNNLNGRSWILFFCFCFCNLVTCWSSNVYIWTLIKKREKERDHQKSYWNLGLFLFDDQYPIGRATLLEIMSCYLRFIVNYRKSLVRFII